MGNFKYFLYLQFVINEQEVGEMAITKHECIRIYLFLLPQKIIIQQRCSF